MLLFNSKALLL